MITEEEVTTVKDHLEDSHSSKLKFDPQKKRWIQFMDFCVVLFALIN